MADEQLVSALYQFANRYGIEPNIAYRQIDRESRFNPNAVSPAGAQGIAQFMPDTARRFGLANPFDPIASFDAWGRYMRLMLDMFGGRYDLALAGYNSGENRNEYKAAAREGRAINWAVLPAGVQRETRNYVIGILGSDAPVTESAFAVEPDPGVYPVDQAQPEEDGIPMLWLALGGLVLIVLVAR
jgi:soluble lytic murein transglycosylase-like protein